MKANENSTRRKFISHFAGTSVALLGGILLMNSCESGDKKQDSPVSEGGGDTISVESCNDYTGVSAEELDKRKKLGYVEKSEVPGSDCSNCGLYIPPAEGAACGGCLLFKGPVEAEGHCIQWVAKAE